MIDDWGYIDIVLMRIIGGLGGSLIAIRGFFIRLEVSLISSIFFTGKLAGYLRWGDDPDSVIAAACIVAAVAWWVWHSLIRLAQSGWLPWIGRRGHIDDDSPSDGWRW
jgi:hypothetical protein